MNRRRWLSAGVGAAAASAGVGFALWRQSSAPTPAATSTSDGEIWRLSFPAPDSSMLSMAQFKGRPLVVNFWATWCPPCVKEMPELDRFARTFGARGWQVLGLAIDGPAPVREFLARVKISFPIGLAGFEGTDLSRRLGNEGGALPFTVVFDRSGRPVQRKLGETSFDQLAAWAQAS